MEDRFANQSKMPSNRKTTTAILIILAVIVLGFVAFLIISNLITALTNRYCTDKICPTDYSQPTQI